MFESRIECLQKILKEYQIDSLLITSTYNISYLTGIKNFSTEEREAKMLVTLKNCYLFTDARYTEMVEKTTPFVILVEISAKKPFLKALKQGLKKEKLKFLGFEEESIIYKEASDIEEYLSGIEFIPTTGIIEELREVKDNDEIKFIKLACQLTDLSFSFIIKKLKPDVSELEIKRQLENFIRLKGGDIAFESIVAFGKNSSIPHHLSGNTKLQSNDIVLLDFGAKVNGYCADMTRTVFLEKPNEQIERMYQATFKAQQIGLSYLKTHMQKEFTLNLVHVNASGHLKALNLPEIPHAIGHGVGLQVHENPIISPFSVDSIMPGMVVTVEPGVYITGTGGIRIEDTVLITASGIDILTKSSKRLTVL